MSTRRGTRERKKPKPLYEVEDRRKDAEEDAEEVGDEEREPQDDEEDDDEREEEEEAFELDERKSTPRKSTRASPQRKQTPSKKKATVPRPRKLKPVPEEGEPRKQKPTQQRTANGEADGEEKAEEEDEDEDDVFFEAVKRGKASMADLVVEWRERFDENAEQATREVLNFVLQSCGGTGECVPPTEKLEKLDMSDLVDYVVDDLEKSNDGYPIASRVKAYKKFHQHFADFWDAFVKECYESELMFSTQIVEQFVDWLTSLSSAEVRAIRHTTTIAAYAVGNALVDCIDKLTQQLSVVQRQLNAESSAKKATKSPKRNSSSKKLDQLRENKKMYEDRQAMLVGLVELLFKGVVMHRYRDVMPEVRVESIRVLGNWISVIPDHFLKDNYLKYLGWVLNDKDALVRLGVIEVLLQLYENDAFTEKMELFTSRFLPRYLEMCNDVDDDVVEACIKLLIAIDKRSLISSEVELHSVERLVFEEDNEVIRKAAAEFVCLQYDAFGVAESNRSAKLTKEQLNTQAIALVEFAEEYITNHQVPAEAVATMVDAFWGLDDCQVLQHWKLLTSLLLADKNAPDLTSEQQTLLIRLLVASVGKITTDETEKSGSANKKKLAKEQEELCVTFCKEIPTMLVRFQGDVEKLSLLVELIPFLTLSGEVTGLQPTHVKSLLEKLRHAYTANSEVGLLKSLALSIHHLRQSDNEVIKRESDVIIHELLQDVLDKLEEALEEDEKLAAGAVSNNEKSRTKRRSSKKKDMADAEYAVRTALTRLHCLITHVYVREFLPQAQVGGSGPPGSRKRGRDSASGTIPDESRMDKLASSLVDFIRRRTRKVTELDSGLLQADSIKFALNILFADVLWLTRPIFSKLSPKEQDDGLSLSATPDASISTEIEHICASRALLEDAVTAVLEMHMNKVEKPRGDDNGESEEPQIEMEEIPLDDPKVALFVKEAQRAAFLIFCDTRCLFVERFKDCPAPFDTLDWSLSKVLVLLTQMYFENEMEFTPEDQPEGEENTEDDDEARARKAASDRGKAEILVALGRVSQSNPSNKRQAAAVLRYLVDGGQDSQEVVRAFSKHIKAEAPVRYLEVQMTALRQLYMTIVGLREELEDIEEDEATREELEETIAASEAEVKELAKKLSQSLGVGKISASLRAPFFRFLCEGVRYALERSTQFSFLEILRVYLSHLDKSSTKQLNAYFTQLLEDLEDGVPTEGDDISAEWRIVFDFQSMISDPDGVVKSTAAKALKRKRKPSVVSSRVAEAGEEAQSQMDVEEGDVEMEDATDATPSKKRRSSEVTKTPNSGGKAASARELSEDGTSAKDVTKLPNQTKASAAKRKLDVVDEDQSSLPKKARSSDQPRRGSCGRITQLSDDEDDKNGEEDGVAAEESKTDVESRQENIEREEEEEEDNDEIASRRSRRRGRGRQ